MFVYNLDDIFGCIAVVIFLIFIIFYYLVKFWDYVVKISKRIRRKNV
jgi:hypothetical protein